HIMLIMCGLAVSMAPEPVRQPTKPHQVGRPGPYEGNVLHLGGFDPEACS
ncbi:MAG: hypothetical protein QOD01_748, partial [Actinomycetota bacterium]|nr:hypothetical protein [Actinomycetota bacterium]